jgi:hypothetical protein
MRRGPNEVLVVTYTDGTSDRFPEAVEIRDAVLAGTLVVFGEALSRELAVLVMANVRKWEWVAP